jgi:hypothetical protein
VARIAPLNGLGNGKSRPAPDMLTARTESELEADFATVAQNRVGALIVMPDPFFMSRRERLVELVARDTVPAIYPSRVFVDLGGLMSYGSGLADRAMTVSERGSSPGRGMAQMCQWFGQLFLR